MLFFNMILVLVFICVTGCEDNSNRIPDIEYDRSTPENTVLGYLKAIDDEEFDEMQTYWIDGGIGFFKQDDPEYRKNVEEGFEKSSLNFSNVETTILSQNEDEAVFGIDSDVRFETRIEITHSHLRMYSKLLKVGENWLLESMMECEFLADELRELRSSVWSIKSYGELDSDYYDIDTVEEIRSVTVDDGAVNLYRYFMDNPQYPQGHLLRPYNITRSGTVEPSSSIMSDWCE